jgi:predicted PurR-regulated permease PerM
MSGAHALLFYLLLLFFQQVRIAFLAGVLLCVALIPVNRLIAQRIQVRLQQLHGL